MESVPFPASNAAGAASWGASLCKLVMSGNAIFDQNMLMDGAMERVDAISWKFGQVIHFVIRGQGSVAPH